MSSFSHVHDNDPRTHQNGLPSHSTEQHWNKSHFGRLCLIFGVGGRGRRHDGVLDDFGAAAPPLEVVLLVLVLLVPVSSLLVGALDEAGPAVLPRAADADGDVNAAADCVVGEEGLILSKKSFRHF